MVKEIKTELDLYYAIVSDLNILLHNIDPQHINDFISPLLKKIRTICFLMSWNEDKVISIIRFFIKYSDKQDSVVMIDED